MIKKLFWVQLVFILLMSAYVVYETATDKEAIALDVQITRHKRMLSGTSEYYNPWQYRIFSMFVLEATIRAYRALIPGSCEICPYLLLRFLQNIAIFYLCLVYYRLLGIKNPLMVWTGWLILCFTFANSSFHSDLSFNTYFDILFYLAGAVLILNNRLLWIVPLTLLAALNRETSGFIPLMLLTPFSKDIIYNKKRIVIAAVSLFLYVLAFVGVRLCYGYQPAASVHGMTSPIEFLQYNITFIRMYALLFGTLGVIPIVVLLGFRNLPVTLKYWFWLIVPAWVIIHLFCTMASETRLFLVPHTLLFVPSFLILIERWYVQHLAAAPQSS